MCVCSGFMCLPKVWVDLRNGFDRNAQIAIGSCSFKTVVNVVNRLYAEDANLRPRTYSKYSTTLPVVITYRQP